MSKQKVYVVLRFTADTYYLEFDGVIGVYKDRDCALVAVSELKLETDKYSYEVQEAYIDE